VGIDLPTHDILIDLMMNNQMIWMMIRKINNKIYARDKSGHDY